MFVVGGIAGASLMKRDGAATTTAYVENLKSKTGKNTKAPKSQGCSIGGGDCKVTADCCTCPGAGAVICRTDTNKCVQKCAI